MRTLLLFLFLAVPCFAQWKPVYATWNETPIPHWHCPAGLHALKFTPPSIPHCEAYGPGYTAHNINYDINYYEYVPLPDHKKTIPNNGVLTISWPASLGLAKVPGCSITGDETDYIQIVEETKERLIIKGKPGQKLSFQCNAIIKREGP